MQQQVSNSPLVEAARNYEFIKCEKGTDHQYYQINQICLVDKCPYQSQPLCNLDLERSIFGVHQHKALGLKPTLQKIAETCVKSQIKHQNQGDVDPLELERLYILAKDFRKIGESSLNISDYLMEIVNGTHGTKGLEALLWDIFLCKNEEYLKSHLKKLRKHIRYDRGEIVMREYRNPKNIISKINTKKKQIEEEIINLTNALKLETQEIQARADILHKPAPKNKLFYNENSEFQHAIERSQQGYGQLRNSSVIKKPISAQFVKSIMYGRDIKEFGNNIYQGSGNKIDMLYSTKPFAKGIHEFALKVEKFGADRGHVYIILMKEENKDNQGNFHSPYHCIYCSDGNDTIAYPQITSNFGPTIKEGSVILVSVDIEGNKFEIRDQASGVHYLSNTQLYGEIWRFAVWFQHSHTRIRII